VLLLLNLRVQAPYLCVIIHILPDKSRITILFIPNDQKASTIIRGRFEAGEMEEQIVVPSLLVKKLLQSIFRIKQIFNTVFILVGLATFLILGLIVLLNRPAWSSHR
jgi:hypothetical protein